MRIEEAIETIQKELEAHPNHQNTAFYRASQLGIEALKKWRVLREGRAGVIDPLLPGETEEQSAADVTKQGKVEAAKKAYGEALNQAWKAWEEAITPAEKTRQEAIDQAKIAYEKEVNSEPTQR